MLGEMVLYIFSNLHLQLSSFLVSICPAFFRVSFYVCGLQLLIVGVLETCHSWTEDLLHSNRIVSSIK